MRLLKKIAYACCSVTFGLLTLTGCTDGKLYDVNAPDWISEGLGHSSLEVTRTYLKRFENEKLSKANLIIMDYVFKGNQRLWNS